MFVSSHLLTEMALMADELVVIGRGRMIANGPVADFTKHSVRNHVLRPYAAGTRPGRADRPAAGGSRLGPGRRAG